MFSILKNAMQQLSGDAAPSMSPEQALHLATATLLVEVGRADFEWDESEARGIVERLAKYFDLNEDEASELMAEATSNAEESVSLHDTLKVINKECNAPRKRKILLDCWRVAYMDGELHKQEEGFIRQIADWLYIPHKDFIQMKHKAEEMGGFDGS